MLDKQVGSVKTIEHQRERCGHLNLQRTAHPSRHSPECSQQCQHLLYQQVSGFHLPISIVLLTYPIHYYTEEY